MRRKTDRDIFRENRFLVGMGICLILCGLIFSFWTQLFPHAPYEELLEKQVTLRSLERRRIGRTRTWCIRTEKGVYFLGGAYDHDTLDALCHQDAEANIKYQIVKPFFSKLIDEMTVDGVTVVTYTPPAEFHMGNWWKDFAMFQMLFTIPGILILLFVWYFVKRNRIQQDKRDRRIAKKYGTPKT